MIPKDIVDWAAKYLLFSSSETSTYAYSFPPRLWKGKLGIIILCEPLRKLSPERQGFVVAHEIAHRKLKHKSAVFDNLTLEEDIKQEDDANKMAAKWLELDEKTLDSFTQDWQKEREERRKIEKTMKK